MRSSVLAEASTSQSVHHLYNKTRSGHSKVTDKLARKQLRYKVLYLRFRFFKAAGSQNTPNVQSRGNRKAKNKAYRNASFVCEYVTSTLLTKRPPSSLSKVG